MAYTASAVAQNTSSCVHLVGGGSLSVWIFYIMIASLIPWKWGSPVTIFDLSFGAVDKIYASARPKSFWVFLISQ